MSADHVIDRHVADGTVLLRTKAGRYHRGFVESGELLTSEGCNLDDSPYEVVVGSADDADPDALCRRCFPTSDVNGAPV